MKCLKCDSSDDKVIDSRSSKDGHGIKRRRECLDCGHRYSTYEEVMNNEIKVVKKDGTRDDFKREKLRDGINKACWKRPISLDDIDKITNKLIKSIEDDFDGEISTSEIGNRVMRALKELDEVAYVRFASVYRQFKDIEEFIEEIKTLGLK